MDERFGPFGSYADCRHHQQSFLRCWQRCGKSSTCTPNKKAARVGGFPERKVDRSPVLLDHALDDVSDDWKLEVLVLVSLVHAINPYDEKSNHNHRIQEDCQEADGEF